MITKNQSALLSDKLSAEVVKESLRWVHGNKGLISDKVGYPSPRISSEIPDCSMPLTFDHYNFCSLGCQYCFAYFFKSNNPSVKSIELRSVNANHIIKTIKGKPTSKRDHEMYEAFYKRKFLLHWGGLADPFCNFERANKVGYKIISALGEENYPTLFSFKGDTIFEKEYVSLFEQYSKQKNFAFQVSIITADEELAKVVEVGVPSPSKRIEALGMLSDMGYWTILRLRPFIIGISDSHLDELLERSLKAGINAVSMEFFAMDARCSDGMRKRYEWLSGVIGVGGGAEGLSDYFKKLSPSERGGYKRLNRLVKEVYVRKVYEFCQKNNLVFACSDPDFKELNMSGSCCGMPDHFPGNPLLENWSRSQLTYHIKECRLKYHRTKELPTLTFEEVYGNSTSPEALYLDSKVLSQDHVSVIGQCNAVRMNLTHRIIIQRQWNNLNSPANPRNYFHGKLMPNGVDSEGNLTYVYNPMEYESRWVSEGVDLSRR